MFLGMGPTELIIILVIALVIFGPKNLPKLGSAVGKTVKNVREGMEGGDDEAAAEDVVEELDEAEEVVEEEPEPEPEPEPAPKKRTAAKKTTAAKSTAAKKTTTARKTTKKAADAE